METPPLKEVPEERWQSRLQELREASDLKTLALLLAVAATEVDPHPEVLRQLRRALQNCRERAVSEDVAGAGFGIVRIFPSGPPPSLRMGVASSPGQKTVPLASGSSTERTCSMPRSAG